MATEHDESGSISPAGRFARMEAALERIENKLDLKADLATVAAIDARVKLIEDSGSPDAREALALAKALQQHQQDLETGRSMTPMGQEYLNRFNEMVRDITALKAAEVTRESTLAAQKQTEKEIADTRYNSMRTLVAVATVVQAVIVVAVTLLSVFHVI